MKIVLEIPEEEIVEKAKQIAAEELAIQIRKGYYEGRVLRDLCKEVIREAIKKNMDELSSRAVAAAAKSIENKAVKKMMNKLLEVETNDDL